MTSRQAQKSPPSVRPRSARWNACECAFTKPGSFRVAAAAVTGDASSHFRHTRVTHPRAPPRYARSGEEEWWPPDAVGLPPSAGDMSERAARTGPRGEKTLLRPGGRPAGEHYACRDGDARRHPASRATPERAHGSATRPHPGVRRAHARGRRGLQLAVCDRLRSGWSDRPDRRLAGAPLARRVGLRQGRGPARRPADDRRRGDRALPPRPAALAGRAPRRGQGYRHDRRVQARRAARVRLLRELPRQTGHLAAVRVAGAAHGHARRHRLATVDLLDGRRARGRRRGALRRQGRAGGAVGVRAVVMAGGEGTRLRPLTSNQPKPMVSIVGKPCMEHILELLRRHGFEDVVVTVAFLPQAIRGYFGDGESMGLNIEYSVEETPLGTAGSVRLASGKLDDTFLVISGDALCDIDLGALVAFHREKGAAATIGLVSVDNPLDFGIVVTDEDGRIERFLEKPSWGQVFSDTVNTGIYVLEPEVLRHVPTDRPYDFSKELFPLLLEMGRPLYGHVCEGYWLDIGNLDQYRQGDFDAPRARRAV